MNEETYLTDAEKLAALAAAAWAAVRVNAILNPELAQTRLNDLDNVMIDLGIEP